MKNEDFMNDEAEQIKSIKEWLLNKGKQATFKTIGGKIEERMVPVSPLDLATKLNLHPSRFNELRKQLSVEIGVSLDDEIITETFFDWAREQYSHIEKSRMLIEEAIEDTTRQIDKILKRIESGEAEKGDSLLVRNLSVGVRDLMRLHLSTANAYKNIAEGFSSVKKLPSVNIDKGLVMPTYREKIRNDYKDGMDE